MQSAKSVKEFLEAKLPEGIELLRQMVGINSYTTNRESVNKLARLTADSFAPLGFSAEYVPSFNPKFGDHLVMTRKGHTQRSITLISHLDTVFPPEEEERNNFHWSVEGDRIFGPGTQDIKGGTVMIWLVLHAIRAQAPEVFEDITWKVILNSSEECYSPDFGDVCRAHFSCDTLAALIFEAEGRMERDHLLVLARKGRATWRATVSGRGAHAGGRHTFGANAIVQIGETVQKIASFTDYSRKLTFNVATITGGTVLNRVPHEAVVEGEFRAFDPQTYEHAKSALRSLSTSGEVRSPVDGYRCEIKTEIVNESRPWPRNPGTDRLYSFWKQAGDELGIPVGGEERGGLSDGNWIWDSVPTLDGLGPWGDNDHCSERSADGTKLPEYVEHSSFVPKAILNVTAILKLAAAPPA